MKLELKYENEVIFEKEITYNDIKINVNNSLEIKIDENEYEALKKEKISVSYNTNNNFGETLKKDYFILIHKEYILEEENEVFVEVLSNLFGNNFSSEEKDKENDYVNEIEYKTNNTDIYLDGNYISKNSFPTIFL